MSLQSEFAETDPSSDKPTGPVEPTEVSFFDNCTIKVSVGVANSSKILKGTDSMMSSLHEVATIGQLCELLHHAPETTYQLNTCLEVNIPNDIDHILLSIPDQLGNIKNICLKPHSYNEFNLEGKMGWPAESTLVSEDQRVKEGQHFPWLWVFLKRELLYRRYRVFHLSGITFTPPTEQKLTADELMPPPMSSTIVRIEFVRCVTGENDNRLEIVPDMPFPVYQMRDIMTLNDMYNTINNDSDVKPYLTQNKILIPQDLEAVHVCNPELSPKSSLRIVKFRVLTSPWAGQYRIFNLHWQMGLVHTDDERKANEHGDICVRLLVSRGSIDSLLRAGKMKISNLIE